MSSESTQYLEEDAAVQLQADFEQIIVESTGMKHTLAAPLATAIVEGMRKRLGGRRVYIPAPRLRREELEAAAERDRAIAAMYNGRNAPEVMKAFSVSRRTVFNAVQRARGKKCK